MLAEQDADFDLAGRGGDQAALSPEQASRYLSQANVRHWVAQVDGELVGHLLCYIEHRRRGAPQQVLLYEIGVRSAWRRRGVGRALIDALKQHMASIDATDVWVLADATAVDFYRACGFVPDREQPLQMTLRTSADAVAGDAESDSSVIKA